MNKRNLRTLNRRKEKKRLRTIIIPPLLLILASLGIFSLVKHNVPIRELVFIGNSRIKNEELRSLIKVKEGDKLFSVSGMTLYSSLKKSAWVKDAAIRRELSGRMLVKITEGIPVAILMLDDIPYLVDKDGGMLEKMRDGTVLFLPIIKGIDPYRNRAAYDEAVRFVNVLHDRRVLAYDGNLEITGRRPEDITLKVDNIHIRVGSGDFNRKLERLEAVKDEIRKRNMEIDYVDLRFANKIIVKPSGNNTEAVPVKAESKGAGDGKKSVKHDDRKKKKE